MRSVGLDSGQFFSFPKSTPVYYIARNSCNEIVPFTHEKTSFKMFFFLILDASILEKEQLKQLRAHIIMRLYSTCKNLI
jgi:hypothetical protein